MYLDMWVFVQATAGSIDYIIDTVSASHPLDPYMSTLKLDGKLDGGNSRAAFVNPCILPHFW
jgi:D-arabinose 1-dehydrogenase-like Zn-dependent alcohol dehydrogenase